MRFGKTAASLASATLVLIGVAAPAAAAPRAAEASGAAKSAIFFMGDGMGQAHRDAGQLVEVGLTGTLAMDGLPVVGMVGTNAAGDPFITDSAAAATAFATGVKTVNGAVGIDPSGKSVQNIVELAKAAGKSVGLVTTSQVTDASPAAFAAHVASRRDQSEIARQLIEEAQVDVILGGGEDRWLPVGKPGAFPDHPAQDPEEASSSDKGDLIARAQELGYQYVSDATGLQTATGPKLLGLFANEEMFQQRPEGQGDVYAPVVSLEQMARKAIDVLSQDPDGFFLFVEEEAIDEMSHENNGTLMIKGVQVLDQAVRRGIDFAAANPDTLLLVTADHECGGLTLETRDAESADESGPGGTFVGEAMATPGAGEATPMATGEAEAGATGSGEDGPFAVAGSDQVLVLDWTTNEHTAVRVPLTAAGPGSERLAGYYENTDIFAALVAAMGLRAPAGTPTVGATPTA